MNHANPAKTQVRTQRVIVRHPQGVASASAESVVSLNEEVTTVPTATAHVLITDETVT